MKDMSISSTSLPYLHYPSTESGTSTIGRWAGKVCYCVDWSQFEMETFFSLMVMAMNRTKRSQSKDGCTVYSTLRTHPTPQHSHPFPSLLLRASWMISLFMMAACFWEVWPYQRCSRSSSQVLFCYNFFLTDSLSQQKTTTMNARTKTLTVNENDQAFSQFSLFTEQYLNFDLQPDLPPPLTPMPLAESYFQDCRPLQRLSLVSFRCPRIE